jgi:hypothetical protein
MFNWVSRPARSAALLRPTSTITAHREAESFPLDDYEYVGTAGRP